MVVVCWPSGSQGTISAIKIRIHLRFSMFLGLDIFFWWLVNHHKGQTVNHSYYVRTGCRPKRATLISDTRTNR